MLDLRGYEEEGEKLRLGYELLEASPDGTVSEVREKQARYDALEDSEEMFHARRLADAWCATFVWPKTREVSMGAAPPPITQETFSNLALNAYTAGRETEKEIERLARDYGFFHWHVAFPNVFGENVEGPGFDVVLGNPPWERIKLQEQEWFAARSPEIATAPNAAARKRKIKALVDDDPDLHAAFLADLRKADGTSHLIRSSGRFPLCGRGDINTYSIFAETKRDIISGTGRVGCIVPSGIATDNTTKDFFADLVSTQTLVSLYDFENKGIFVDVDSRMKFSLLTLTGARRPARAAEFAFFCHAVSDLRDPERRFPLSADDIRLLNPNTRTCPIFRTRRDAEITKEIYRRVPVLIDENKKDGNPWGITIRRVFDMGNAETQDLMRRAMEDPLPVVELPMYEAKLIHQYDHRFASYRLEGKAEELTDYAKRDYDLQVAPRYYAPKPEVDQRTARFWSRDWLLCWRDIARNNDERTFIAGVIPYSASDFTVRVGYPDSSNDAASCAVLLGNLNSFVQDYSIRLMLGGTHLSDYITKQLPVLPPETYDAPAAWEPGSTLSDWISSRVLELTYTAWDLAPFARDLGHEGPPFAWDPERRFRLRSELDAAYFHLYGIAREDVEYIMDTFPIVRRKDEAAHGEYRTRRVILEIYDQMAAAAPTAATETTPEPETPPATVTRLRPRPRDEGRDERAPANPTEPRPEETPSMPLAAEGRSGYESPARCHPEPEDRTDSVTQSPPAEETSFPNGINQPQPPHAAEVDTTSNPPPEAPNSYDAALALNACLPEGQKVPQDALLQDAARELGHPKLTRKVKTALNKALNTEHNAGRLKTDWKHVWKPRKK